MKELHNLSSSPDAAGMIKQKTTEMGEISKVPDGNENSFLNCVLVTSAWETSAYM
jgi:hypothetical protein